MSIRWLSRVAVAGLLLGAGASSASAEDRPKPPPEPHWYERIQLRGYAQLRYNRIGATNPHLKNSQGDRSLGEPGSFVRRARLIFSGEVASFLGVYLQPDFASAFDDALNGVQMRDWYADIFLTPQTKELRLRVGQQKVPYGWELMQSSGNRLPLDRSDGMNSAFVNERDIGAFLYYETPAVRRRFKHLLDSGLKGSGDYGMTAIGVTNGQPLNSRERNDNKHFFARVTYPFDVGSQTLELAAGGYTGLFVPARTAGVGGRNEIRDLRMHATFVLYPKPFGLQVEYNAGVGPELAGGSVVERPLDGGYVMAMWRQKVPFGHVTPFVRVHRYDGGKKFEDNSPRHEVRELNVGIEWQFQKWVELTTEFMESDRIVAGRHEAGRLLRLQLQFNY